MATFIENITDIIPESKTFTPDFSFIDKMLKRKESQYDQGFQKLNNQYNLISREVTNDANAKVRDQFLQNAKTSLKDLSAMDLSDQTNVNAAGEVFKPFYSNINVIGDQGITSHWKQQLSIGESYRLKDGGKEFSQDNLDYITQQREAFRHDDPSSVGNYLAAKRSYNPYFDYNKEVTEAMKNFKPSHTKIEKMEGMYTRTVDDQSWNKLEIAQYLNSVLSDKAKAQMKIESTVRLSGNPGLVAQSYMQTEAAELPNLTSLINKYDGDIKLEKDPTKLAELKKVRDYYNDQKTEITNNVANIQKGDVSFLKKNAEALSYKAYYNTLISKTANGFSHVDIAQSIGINEVAAMYFKNSEEWRRTYYNNEQLDKRAAKVKADLYSEPISVEQPGTNIETDLPTLQENVKKAGDARDQAYQSLLITIGLDLNKSASSITEDDFNRWKIAHPKGNADYIAYTNACTSYNNKQDMINLHKEGAENYVKEQLSSPENYAMLLEYRNALTQSKNQRQNIQQQVSEGRLPSSALVNVDFTNDPVYKILKKYNTTEAHLKDLNETANISRTEYNSKKFTQSTKNASGWGFQAEDPRFKLTTGYLKGTLGVDNATGVNFFTESGDPSKFTIRYKAGDDVIKDGGAKEVTRLKQTLGENRNVVYNEATQSISISGLGEAVAKQIDPYFGVPALHQEIFENLHNFNGNVGAKVQSPYFTMMNKNGDEFQCTITKIIYPGQDGYRLNLNGKSLEYKFVNTLDSYNAIDIIINDAKKLDILK